MAGFAGFDISIYPGNPEMVWLKANTNLSWCAYYLAPAPDRGDPSWMGKRASLVAGGWGIAPVYVGQQRDPPGVFNLSLAQGGADGAAAVALMTSEGFPAGNYVYLDLENGPPLPKSLSDYVAGWCDAVSASSYRPGVYCSHTFAAEIHQLRPASRIWAFNVPRITPHPFPGTNFPTLDPAASGYAGAFAWQLGDECQLTLPGAPAPKLTVDLDVAVTADPGAP